jgi:short-subunit dehydrogenase
MRIAIIGASRGLGACLCKIIPENNTVLAVARKRELLEKLGSNTKAKVQPFVADLSRDIRLLLDELDAFSADVIFCLAGGGPFGAFESKAWKDHVWAWQVGFLSVAQIVHAALNQKVRPRQIVLCGSAVAEQAGDPNAASYASAKHALRGLYESLKLENPALDLRLFSPGYLDTELLPKNAEVRYKGVWDPQKVAEELWTWSLASDHGGHRLYTHHPK